MNKLIYIDESCHLENDKLPLMCIGYTKLNAENYLIYKEEIKAIKRKHHSPKEIKWNKTSLSRLDLYKELIDYFFEKEIQFRAILVKNKSQLNHEKYNKGDHNSFYYKLVFLLLRNPWVNSNEDSYKVILDIKDLFFALLKKIFYLYIELFLHLFFCINLQIFLKRYFS